MLNYYEVGKCGKYFIVNEVELIEVANEYIKRYEGAKTVGTVDKAIEFLERYNNLSIHEIKRYKNYVDSVVDRLDII